MSTAIHREVEQARNGVHPRVVCRTGSGWVVLAPSQVLLGYCLLLPDPVVHSLNDLPEHGRARFLLDMAHVGDAVTRVCKPLRLNYAMLGNQEQALHAHIIPRYAHEPEHLRGASIWSYHPAQWNDPAHAFDKARHAELIAKLREDLQSGASTGQFLTEWMI